MEISLTSISTLKNSSYIEFVDDNRAKVLQSSFGPLTPRGKCHGVKIAYMQCFEMHGFTLTIRY